MVIGRMAACMKKFSDSHTTPTTATATDLEVSLVADPNPKGAPSCWDILFDFGKLLENVKDTAGSTIKWEKIVTSPKPQSKKKKTPPAASAAPAETDETAATAASAAPAATPPKSSTRQSTRKLASSGKKNEKKEKKKGGKKEKKGGKKDKKKDKKKEGKKDKKKEGKKDKKKDKNKEGNAAIVRDDNPSPPVTKPNVETSSSSGGGLLQSSVEKYDQDNVFEF